MEVNKKMERNEKPNRQYKDSVFVDLFTHYKEHMIVLYNALNEDNLPLSTPVENLKVMSTLYTSIRNDVSFLIGKRILILVEHQSTINNNMPFRLLLYVAEIYKQIVPEDARYAKDIEEIPMPVFFVLYNGGEPLPERSELRLSDSFMGIRKNAQLELVVPVLNINAGCNENIMNACGILKEYALFVEKVRQCVELYGEDGFETAIDYCIEHNILREYLTKQRKVVRNMLQNEYNYDLDIKVQRAEARKQAYAEGQLQERYEMAKRMKNKNCEPAFIMEMTKLSQQEIERL